MTKQERVSVDTRLTCGRCQYGSPTEGGGILCRLKSFGEPLDKDNICGFTRDERRRWSRFVRRAGR